MASFTLLCWTKVREKRTETCENVRCIFDFPCIRDMRVSTRTKPWQIISNLSPINEKFRQKLHSVLSSEWIAFGAEDAKMNLQKCKRRCSEFLHRSVHVIDLDEKHSSSWKMKMHLELALSFLLHIEKLISGYYLFAFCRIFFDLRGSLRSI